MSDGTDIAYATGELRGGAAALSAVQRSADLATTTLQAAVLTPEMFGRTPGAGGYVAAAPDGVSSERLLGSPAPPTVVDPGGVQRDRGGEDRVDRSGN